MLRPLLLSVDRIGSWKTDPARQDQPPGTGDYGDRSVADKSAPSAEVEGQATTGRAGASREICGCLRGVEGGRRQAEHTGPSARSRRGVDPEGAGRQEESWGT